MAFALQRNERDPDLRLGFSASERAEPRRHRRRPECREPRTQQDRAAPLGASTLPALDSRGSTSGTQRRGSGNSALRTCSVATRSSRHRDESALGDSRRAAPSAASCCSQSASGRSWSRFVGRSRNRCPSAPRAFRRRCALRPGFVAHARDRVGIERAEVVGAIRLASSGGCCTACVRRSSSGASSRNAYGCALRISAASGDGAADRVRRRAPRRLHAAAAAASQPSAVHGFVQAVVQRLRDERMMRQSRARRRGSRRRAA